MPINLASGLIWLAITASILPPGYPAYVGAYIALGASLLALLVYGWRGRTVFAHPTSLAIVTAVTLVSVTVPFVYKSSQDLLGPMLILPMFVAIALGALSASARAVPPATVFALICLAGSFLGFAGGAYEQYVLGVQRAGLGNNPIHYGSMIAMIGCLAIVGVAASQSPWRILFFLGPVFAFGAAGVSGSRGALAGTLAMAAAGTIVLTFWYWRQPVFRLIVLGAACIAAAALFYLAGSGDFRALEILANGANIFRITGGPDDIRAALYISALEALKSSPVVGIGLGQIMIPAETMFRGLVVGRNLENLHADWANFAAMAGSLGLVAWILLLLAPLLLLTDRKGRRDRTTVLAAVLLTTGQAVLGVSNATFGILPQTLIYAVALGYFLLRARQLPDTTAAQQFL